MNSFKQSTEKISFRFLPNSLLFIVLLLPVTGCLSSESDSDYGGILLPDDFEAVVVADSIGRARHLAVNDNGDIYVKLRQNEKGIVALRDTDNDGKADIIETFGDYPDEGGGTGAEIYNGYLYFSNSGGVYRYKLSQGELIPKDDVEIILAYDYRNARDGAEHTAKPIVFDHEENMYIPFGSPSDVCQEENRIPGSVGKDPCPELEFQAGVWQFNANTLGQSQADGIKYATGIRSVTGFDWNHEDSSLYVLQHGRDYMVRYWPELYTPWESAVLPAEEFMRVSRDSDFGWPYCYYDQMQGKRVLNPEYGGDGELTGRCGDFDTPLMGFSGHWAPNDLLFYTKDQFPERYKNGAFMAFHGSTTREGYPQAGYSVIFVPFKDGLPTGQWELFANGFAGYDPLENQSDALHRPMGLAMGPDGSLYISDSVKGKIWRVMFKGDRENFGEKQLAGMEEEKRTASNVREPHEADDYMLGNTELTTVGGNIYQTYCRGCHQSNGQGSFPRWPPLAGTDWVTGDKQRLISVILNGLNETIEVNGEEYSDPMPQHGFLSDEDVAGVATYIRQNFGNDASAITTEEVREVREAL